MPNKNLENQIREQIKEAALGPREPGETKKSVISAANLGKIQEMDKGLTPTATPQSAPQSAPQPGPQPDQGHRNSQQGINRVSQQGQKYTGKETLLPPGQKPPSMGKKVANETVKRVARYFLPVLGTGGVTGAIAYFLS